MTSRWPWGDGPAPALRCDECRKRIGRPRTHFITASQNLLYLGGLYAAGATQPTHYCQWADRDEP